MSVVVGVIDNGEIYMAADSACSSLDGSWVREDATPKIYHMRNFLVGIVGKSRVSDLIVEHIDPEQTVNEYEMVEMIRTALRMGGALKVQNGVESMEAEVLLGWRGSLYHVVSNFGIFRPRANYHAIGAGAPYALGALAVMDSTDWLPGTPRSGSSKVNIAVEAAAAFCPSVGGRVQGLRLKAEEKAS